VERRVEQWEDFMRQFVRASTLALACALSLAAPAAAEDFYKGKTITIMVANAAGGGYDLYARLLTRHMGRHIPGEPSFIVKNQPGAGGMVMANAMYSTVPRDGLTIGMMSRANPLEPVLGNPAAKFKSENFTWLGTSSSYEDDAYCLVIRADSPIKTIEDARKPGRPVIFGGLAAGGTDTDLVLIARTAFSLNLQLIRGYGGSPDINMAIMRGEVDGRAIGMSSLQNSMAEWLKAGKLRFLAQFGHETRWKGMPDVPTARELAKTPEDKALVELAELPLLLARPFIAPPEIPQAQAAILKQAFMATQSDPDYLKEAKDLQLDISPLSGDEIQRILTRIAHSSPELIERYKDILASK
jgi:tripartite-type tricarboxylate transporter receptor subunit TctC